MFPTELELVPTEVLSSTISRVSVKSHSYVEEETALSKIVMDTSLITKRNIPAVIEWICLLRPTENTGTVPS